jgi:hypothetical protein
MRHPCCASPQTEELLVKRRNLLEKKVDQETERAKEFTRLKNKRGERCSHQQPALACTAGQSPRPAAHMHRIAAYPTVKRTIASSVPVL